MLRTKCILANPSPEDGKRISVMSRHTLSDGKTPDSRITPDRFDMHLIGLAPRPRLVGAYYRGEIGWEEYQREFSASLNADPQLILLREIISLALVGNITLLCIEQSPEKCHRRLIAQKCLELEKDLQVNIE